MGRPRKPAALRAIEGNRSRRDIPAELELQGTPELQDRHGDAAEHFKFLAAEFGGAGVLKRADGPALAKLADLWRMYWLASDVGDIDAACKLSAAWDRAASKLGLQVIDRSKLITAHKQTVDPTRAKFLKIAT